MPFLKTPDYWYEFLIIGFIVAFSGGVFFKDQYN